MTDTENDPIDMISEIVNSFEEMSLSEKASNMTIFTTYDWKRTINSILTDMIKVSMLAMPIEDIKTVYNVFFDMECKFRVMMRHRGDLVLLEKEIYAHTLEDAKVKADLDSEWQIPDFEFFVVDEETFQSEYAHLLK